MKSSPQIVARILAAIRQAKTICVVAQRSERLTHGAQFDGHEK